MQVFIIHRHGARYPMKRPHHNAVWPVDKPFWKQHVAKLTPVGVMQMQGLGHFFRGRYRWVQPRNVTVYATHKSRALESAWSFVLGLLPGVSLKYNPMTIYKQCEGTQCDTECQINYYEKSDDIIFGSHESHAYKININQSPLLNDLITCPVVNNLINRLSEVGQFRIRRDAVTTVSKLKDIYSQLQIDSQLNHNVLHKAYELEPEELERITQIGCEVMHRRSIPATDLMDDPMYNAEQGIGILTLIAETMSSWNARPGNDMLTLFSCHDTNIVAMMAILGLKIQPPNFSGYILIERTLDDNDDTVAIYYCPDPFIPYTLEPKIWPRDQTTYLNWDTLSPGVWNSSTFLELFN